MTVSIWLKKNASTILTCLGAGGMMVTVGLAIAATPKAVTKIEAVKARKPDEEDCEKHSLTITETIQACWKEYIPTVVVGTGSVLCIFGANILSRRQQASLASAYTALAASFEAYRDKVETLCGPGTNAMVEKAIAQEQQDAEDDRPPWDTIQTFYIEGQPRFFERTMEQVMQAEYHLNRNFILKGSVTLNEFYDFLNLPHTEEGENLGWDSYDGEAFYGYQWIDFVHRYYTTEDYISVCSIDMPFSPHPFGEPE